MNDVDYSSKVIRIFDAAMKKKLLIEMHASFRQIDVLSIHPLTKALVQDFQEANEIAL